jgi:hypothetical protein
MNKLALPTQYKTSLGAATHFYQIPSQLPNHRRVGLVTALCNDTILAVLLFRYRDPVDRIATRRMGSTFRYIDVANLCQQAIVDIVIRIVDMNAIDDNPWNIGVFSWSLFGGLLL